MNNPITPSLPQTRRVHFGRRPWHWWVALAGLLLLLILAFLGYRLWRMSDVPDDLDFATTRLSEQGLYSATIQPEQQPVPVNRLHSWTLHLTAADGQPIEDAQITVNGDMPQHGHGMPTQPMVTQNLGGGDYLVEGMKFQMGGWWVIEFTVTAAGQSDTVSFNLMLPQ